MSYRLIHAMEFTESDEQKKQLRLRFDGFDSEMIPIYMFYTREGFRRLYKGDYVAINSDGEGWIISPQTMEEMYVEVNEELLKREQEDNNIKNDNNLLGGNTNA